VHSGNTAAVHGGEHCSSARRGTLQQCTAGNTAAVHGGEHCSSARRGTLQQCTAGNTAAVYGGEHCSSAWRGTLQQCTAGNTAAVHGGEHCSSARRGTLQQCTAGNTAAVHREEQGHTCFDFSKLGVVFCQESGLEAASANVGCSYQHKEWSRMKTAVVTQIHSHHSTPSHSLTLPPLPTPTSHTPLPCPYTHPLHSTPHT